MSYLDKLEAGVRHFLSEMRAEWAKHPPFASLDFPGQREVAIKARARWREGGPEMAQTTERVFDPGAGELRIRIYMPEGAAQPAPALVYLHGGGFTLFSIDTHDRLMREYAAAGGFAVIGVDYPLSPEHKYPVALDRIEALMLWLGAHGGELGIDGTRLAIGGDSAGANLAFATTLRLRARGSTPVRAILSNYGFFSTDISDEAEAQFGGEGTIMDRAEVLSYAANYVAHDDHRSDPHAFPLNADLSGLPPVVLIVPDSDILTEQSIAMEARLRDAGVEVDCHIYAGATHSFLEAMSVSDIARRAIADGAAFVREKTAAR